MKAYIKREISALKKPGSIPALDGLRGYAAILVLVGHLFYGDADTKGARVNIAEFGVVLFFSLSGFLISLYFWKRSENKNFNFKLYFWKRVIRILPLFYAWFLVQFLAKALSLSAIDPAKHAVNLWEVLIANIFLYQNYFKDINLAINAPSWSVAVEAQFYVLIAIVFGVCMSVLSMKRKLVLVIWGVLLILGLIYTQMVYGFDPFRSYIYANLLARLPSFVLGIFLGYFFVFGKKTRFSVSVSVFILVVGVLFFYLDHQLKDSNIYTRIHPLLFAISAILIIIPNVFVKLSFFDNNFARFAGKISYSLYLLHLPIWYGFFLPIVSQYLDINSTRVLFILCIFCIATISYIFFERPFLRIKSTLS